MRKKIFALFLCVFQLLTFVPIENAEAAFPTSYNWEWWGYAGAGAFMSLHIDPDTSGRIFAQSDVSGTLVSTNGATSWGWTTTGSKNMSGSAVITAPSNTSIMYHVAGRDTSGGGIESSIDAGLTWTNHLLGSAYAVNIQGHKAVAVNRTDASTAYAGFTTGANAGEIWRTTNRTTWTEWKTAAQTGMADIYAMVVDKSNTYLWAGHNGKIIRVTLADGTVQTHTLTGTNPTRNYDLVATTINSTNYIFAAAGNRLAYTTDHGANWTYLATISGITSSFFIGRFDVFPGATLGATKIMVGTRSTNGGDINNGTKYKTSDGGATWATATGTSTLAIDDDPTRLTANGTLTYTLSLVADPHDATGNTWYGSDFWGIWKTTDFGVTWIEKVTGAGNSVMTDLAITANGTVVATAMDNGVLKRKNGDAYWTQLIPNADGNQAYPQVSGHAWQVATAGTAGAWNGTTGKIFATNSPWSGLINKGLRSINSGDTWTLITPPAAATGENAATGLPDVAEFGGMWGTGYFRALAQDPNDENHLIGTIDGTFGSTSAGTTADATANTFSMSAGALIVNDRVMIGGTAVPTGSSSTTRYWVVNPASTTFQIATTKGGSAVDITTAGTAVTYTRRRDGGLFESADFGSTWKRVTHPTETGTSQWPNTNVYNGLAINPTNSANWIMALWSGSGFAYTTNSGSTWAFASSGNQGYCNDVKFSSTGVAYAACDAGGPAVYRSSNSGQSWTQIKKFDPPSGPADAIAIDPADANSLVVSTTGYAGRAPEKLYRTSSASTDTAASNNFVDITGNLPDGVGFHECAFNNTDGYLYCGRYAGSVFRMNLQTEAPTIGVLASTNVQPASLVQNAVGSVVISATTDTAWPATGVLEVDFGTGAGSFTFSSGGATAASFTSGGSGSISVSTSGNTLILTRSGGSQIAADTAFQITATQIKNPQNVTSTGVYALRTKDSSGNVIDQDLAVSADTLTSSATTSFKLVINCQGQNCWITTT